MNREHSLDRAQSDPNAIHFPVGPVGMLQVSPMSSHEERQEVASSLLDVAGRLATDMSGQSGSVESIRWAVAYLTSIGKGLLDSMDLCATA